MFFGLPDMSSDLDDPRMYAIRRYLDLFYSVLDHYDNLDELESEQKTSDSSTSIGYSADCGYVLRLEMRIRRGKPETGFTLVQIGHDLHSPLIRASRRMGCSWQAYQLNMENASSEMHLLMCGMGLVQPSARYEFTELRSNKLFGLCCEMMIYGFLSNRQKRSA